MASLSLNTFITIKNSPGRVAHNYEDSSNHYRDMVEFQRRAKEYQEMADASQSCYESLLKMAYAKAYRALRNDPEFAHAYAVAAGGDDR